jgi:hypothetical protein
VGLWTHVVFPIILAPAWAALGVLGLILLALSFLFGRGRRRLFRRA